MKYKYISEYGQLIHKSEETGSYKVLNIDKPYFLSAKSLATLLLLKVMLRDHALRAVFSVALHQYPLARTPVGMPDANFSPPGKAVKPVWFVDPVLGVFQCVVSASFNFNAEMLSPPKKEIKIFNPGMLIYMTIPDIPLKEFEIIFLKEPE